MCFNALDDDDETRTTLSANTRLRLVRFGIESGSNIPLDWVWQAMRISAASEDLEFVLLLALKTIAHDDPQRSAEAILRAVDYAYFLGNQPALRESLDALESFLGNAAKLGTNTRITLMVVSIHFRFVPVDRTSRALEAFDEWEREAAQLGINAQPMFQAARVRALAMTGNVRRALETYETISGGSDVKGEWITAPAHTYEALLLVQRGEFNRAISLASSTRRLVLLRDISPTSSGDLEGFAVFLGHWARGTSQSAKQAVEAFVSSRGDLTAIHIESGLVDLSIALLASQEGRWLETSDLTGRLVKKLASNDPFGITAFAYALQALSLAVIGEHAGARDALRLSDIRKPGISQALYGFVGITTLRARHWLRDDELTVHALTLASWAREENLPLIELEAIDIAAHEAIVPEPAFLARAEELVVSIDPPIGQAILDHIRALTHSAPGSAEPEERLLSQLGVWLPLPPAEPLTGREREVALFTALGYSSKHVAERLHLSARTVETHLTHVYGKLGITNREDLRDWFTKHRERELPATS